MAVQAVKKIMTNIDDKPVKRALFFTKQRITHKASCKDRSASSKTSLLDPLIKIETAFPLDLRPVTFKRN